ncbi:MAG: FG-GAP-like repeat-containing protein [Janthinobacterium lividum]
MLERLRIQNFKSWQDTGDMAFGALTGFFGTNSSGKSSSWGMAAGLLLASGNAALGQALVITSAKPQVNAQAARNSPVIVSFSQSLLPNSVSALKVFSNQRGGLRTHALPAMVHGQELRFAPTNYSFMPGETVSYTVTKATASRTSPLARGWVGQFTAAADGTGTGNYHPQTDSLVLTSCFSLALADVDGDGDLDVVTAGNDAPPFNEDRVLRVRLNTGGGHFGDGQELPIAGGIIRPALADIDGDGDLDVVGASSKERAVRVYRNDGRGTYLDNKEALSFLDMPQDISQQPRSVVLGDLDGDGDLDLLTANASSTSGGYSVSIRFNNGKGIFSGGRDMVAGGGGFPQLLLGDIDGDGDLDLLTKQDDHSGNKSDEVLVYVNDGRGNFHPGPTVPTTARAITIALADLDGDGDLDLLAESTYALFVRLNTGDGTFSPDASRDLKSTELMNSVTLGDVDGDGDLDLLVDYDYQGISVRLNDGRGAFSSRHSLVGRKRIGSSSRIALGDLDGDGDLDFVNSYAPGSYEVLKTYLNQPE